MINFLFLHWEHFACLCKLLCKARDRVAAEDKNSIVYQIDCSNCEAVYFSESIWSLKSRSDKHKRSFRNYDCDKNDTAKHCWEADHNFTWDQKKVVYRENRLIPRKIKKPYILWRILITLTKFRTCFLKFGLLTYGSS